MTESFFGVFGKYVKATWREREGRICTDDLGVLYIFAY